MGMMGWDESVMRQIVASKRVRASRKVLLKPWVGAIALRRSCCKTVGQSTGNYLLYL